MKTSTLIKLARDCGAGNWKWTCNEIRDFVLRVAGKCRTKSAARAAIAAALNGPGF